MIFTLGILLVSMPDLVAKKLWYLISGKDGERELYEQLGAMSEMMGQYFSFRANELRKGDYNGQVAEIEAQTLNLTHGEF